MTKIRKHTSKSLVVFREFCQSTSLHGYSYLIIAESLVLKLLWLVVILGMTGLGIQFLVTHTQEYLKGRILTTVESYSAPLSVSWLELKLIWKGIDSLTPNTWAIRPFLTQSKWNMDVIFVAYIFIYHM